jgi:hypothetical protein
MTMKALLASLAVVAMTLSSFSAEEKPTAKGRPYPLKTCVVSDEKFGGDMGDPYVFTYEGREVKLCCEGCLKDFKKNPAKYLKKMDAAEKKK